MQVLLTWFFKGEKKARMLLDQHTGERLLKLLKEADSDYGVRITVLDDLDSKSE
jgi:hypothetical protein